MSHPSRTKLPIHYFPGSYDPNLKGDFRRFHPTYVKIPYPLSRNVGGHQPSGGTISRTAGPHLIGIRPPGSRAFSPRDFPAPISLQVGKLPFPLISFDTLFLVKGNDISPSVLASNQLKST
jgi:hypothetical protein